MTAMNKKNLCKRTWFMGKPETYDGLYFLPGDEDDEMAFAFFDMKDENYKHEPIENNSIGDKFHIAFFKRDENGDVTFDEHFEAIFGDPMEYLKALIGMDLFGCMVRKTETSKACFDSFLKKAQQFAAPDTNL
jgi:hypothetical protein